MNYLQDPDSTINMILRWIMEAIETTVILVVSCVLILPAGASLCSLFEIMQRKTADQSDFSIPLFIRTFRKNFKDATVLWLLLLAAGVLLSFEFYYVFFNEFSVDPLLMLVVKGLIIETDLLYMTILLMAFQVMAFYHTSVWKTVKYALILAIKGFRYFILMSIVYALPVLLGALNPLLIVYLILFAPWCCIYLSSKLFLKIADILS